MLCRLRRYWEFDWFTVTDGSLFGVRSMETWKNYKKRRVNLYSQKKPDKSQNSSGFQKYQ